MIVCFFVGCYNDILVMRKMGYLCILRVATACQDDVQALSGQSHACCMSVLVSKVTGFLRSCCCHAQVLEAARQLQSCTGTVF